jgi:hypothetical protein
MVESIKTTLTLRLPPELKNDLSEEAEARTKTLSSYVEHLLVHRLKDEGGTVTVQDLRQRILELELDNEKLVQKLDVHAHEGVYTPELHGLTEKNVELTNENKMLRRRVYELDEHLKTLVQQRDTLAKIQTSPLPYWMTEGSYKQLLQHLKVLKDKHPKHSEEELLLLAMTIINRNEGSFVMHTVPSFLKANPHYFTSKTLSA